MITVDKIRLQNVTVFSDRTFEFSSGLNIISADNGFGKSTIIKAINIALFDNISSIGDMVSYGENSGTITINFRIDSYNCTVSRLFGKKSGTSLNVNGETVYGNKEVYARLREMIGKDNISYITSRNLINPLSGSRADRQKFFDSVFGVNKYREVYDDLALVIKELDVILSDLSVRKSFLVGRSSIDVDSTKYQSELTVEEEQQEVYLNYIFLQSQYNSILKNINDIRKKIKFLESSLELDNKKIESLNNKICNECGNKIDDIKSVNMITKLSDSINKDLRDLDKLTIEFNELKLNLDGLGFEWRYDVQDRSQRISYLKSTIDMCNVMEQEFDKVRNDIKLLESDISIYNSKLDRLKYIRSNIYKIPSLIIKSMFNKISIDSSSMLSSMMDENVNIRFSDDYDVIVDTNNGELAFSQLSDGQQNKTALSILLCIIKNIYDIGVIFLDEPTVNLDHIGRMALSNILSSNLISSQLIVVTHDDSFILNGDKTIYI